MANYDMHHVIKCSYCCAKEAVFFKQKYKNAAVLWGPHMIKRDPIPKITKRKEATINWLAKKNTTINHLISQDKPHTLYFHIILERFNLSLSI